VRDDTPTEIGKLYPHAGPLLAARWNEDLISDCWPDLLRMGGSLKYGQASASLIVLSRCPRVHLLATSREPLGIGGETLYRVPSLSLPGPGQPGLAAAESSDAVALFADRARAQGTGLRVDEQTAPLVVSICQQLDGMPLAIELAAARLRSMSLPDLHGRLGQRFRLLTGAAAPPWRGSRRCGPRSSGPIRC
jgi:hypothetical protein